jgi:uncharacterized coiled-coil DUF342 family protein
MVTQQSTDEIRAELQEIEQELAELRPRVAELRRQIGERWDAPRDPADLSAALTLAEEQEAIVATLEARRDTLLGRLSEGP